jgi:DNA-binding CsgD family transcriptional regulator
MSKSVMLRVRDVRDAFRLIGDCRDVGGDPGRWQTLAFDGLCRLVGAHAATGGEGIWLRPSQPVRPMTHYVVGLDDQAVALHSAYMRKQGLRDDPIFHRLQQLPEQISTYSRRELVPDRDWYRWPGFHEYRQPVGCDHQLTSVCQVGADGAASAITIHRAPGERDFSLRECAIARFFHTELGRLIGGALVSGIEPGLGSLSPRVRQTFDCLLEGDSEKQVAARLGLSTATVHQYVTTLYRRLGVRSRAELMAYAFKRRHDLR